jgi:hypothetical protein
MHIHKRLRDPHQPTFTQRSERHDRIRCALDPLLFHPLLLENLNGLRDRRRTARRHCAEHGRDLCEDLGSAVRGGQARPRAAEAGDDEARQRVLAALFGARVPREADGADGRVRDAGEVEGTPPGGGVDEEGFGVVPERSLGCYGSFGGWERWVKGDVAVERGGGRDDDFAALDGEGASSGGHGAVAVGGLGDGGDGVGEEDGGRGKGHCEGFGEGLCACAAHVRRLDGKGPWSTTRGQSLLSSSLFLVDSTCS